MRIPVPDILARAEAGETIQAVAASLDMSPTQLRERLIDYFLRGWPPRTSLPSAPPDVVRLRAAELHWRLEHGPHAIDRLADLILGRSDRGA